MLTEVSCGGCDQAVDKVYVLGSNKRHLDCHLLSFQEKDNCHLIEQFVAGGIHIAQKEVLLFLLITDANLAMR